MPRAATEQQRHDQLPEALGQTKCVIEEQLAAIHDRLAHVAESVLRDAVNEEKEVIEWAAQNGKSIFGLTSMSVDPTDPDLA